MGMFDDVVGRCACGALVSTQSKAGECTLAVYGVEEGVPIAVAADVNGDVVVCTRCGAQCTFEFPTVLETVRGKVVTR